MGNRPTAFASDHSSRRSRHAKLREPAAQPTLRARDGGRPFYEVVATLSTQFLGLPARNASHGIDEAIRSIAVSLPAERVTLYLRSADATSFVEIAQVGSDAGSSTVAGDFDARTAAAGIESIALGDYPWLAGQLGKCESVFLPHVEELPENATAERSLFREERVASLFFAPMTAHGALLGFLKVEALGAPRNWSGELRALTRVVLDLVAGLIERKRTEDSHAATEARLRTTQRLEIVGRLASGIAHDFNNYLTAILGYGELLSLEFEEDGRGHEEIHEIRNAADRASSLVEQILAFSRAKSGDSKSRDSKILDLNSVVAMLAKIIDRVAGAEVEVAYRLGVDIGAVRVDPARFDQVILNLVANARDAMVPRGGVLTIATNSARVDSGEKIRLDVGCSGEELEIQSPQGIAPGEYIVMSVLDTGCGMTEVTRAHLFEPFYTTKRAGRGTGIGLSTVAGIVESCGGAIVVESELHKGSAFHLFLPRTDECASLLGHESHPQAIASGRGETLLLVEPEDLVRGLLQRVLTRCGYEVVAVADGTAALRECDSRNGPIHLLVTDLAMPRLCGREIAEQVSLARPSIRVLFTSSYSQQALRDEGVWHASVPVLEKPFSVHGLAQTVREALDGTPSTPARD